MIARGKSHEYAGSEVVEIKMKEFLNDIRAAENAIPLKKKIINSVLILVLGIALGTFSKFLDCTPSNELPFIFEYLDVSNFLGRFAIWVTIALCVSIYSNSSLRAAINVFLFFAGMVTSYYLYSKYVAGFFPRSYAMIWIAFTMLSPILAFICWYAKGKSKLAFILSAIILAILFNMTFIYGVFYFDIRSILELITFVCAIVVLKRNTIKDTMLMFTLSCGIAFILNLIIPFHYG